jgi:hypothetical protein
MHSIVETLEFHFTVALFVSILEVGERFLASGSTCRSSALLAVAEAQIFLFSSVGF